jgi:phospholipid transport system substrate-binding protein
MKKFLLFIFLSLMIFSNHVLSVEPDVFVQSTVNRASQVLSSSSTINEKIDKLKVIAKETVDIKGIGFYTLGAYRKNLNDDQKKEYSVLF